MVKINVVQLKKNVGSKQNFKFIISAEKVFANEELPVWVRSKFVVFGEVINNGRFIDFSGTVSLQAGFQCTCCLEDYEIDMEIPFADSFHEGTGDEFEMDYTYYIGDEIDITCLVRESVLLAEPLKPLCQENCKGLCAECGVNLNEKTCSCSNELIDPRLAVLKQFLK